ncbi:MAG: hypothetical protein PHW03_05295 [Eubacteriales bacterium]|nr:hypothetical protein [Eubacteriales bacterium]
MHGDVTSYDSGTGALVVNVLDVLGSGTYTDWTITFSAPINNLNQIQNLKLVVNAAVNKLDIFAQSNGAAPDSSNPIGVQIPDGNGNIYRTRAATVLGGSTQFILADATAYWGAVSGTGKIKLHTYEIWDAANSVMVPALSRFSGFLNVPTTTTATDDDYFLLPDGCTYTRAATDFCVCTGSIWANYNTANTPDWTIYQASDGAALAPQIIWNPKSDYGYQKNLATTVTVSNSDIAEYSAISVVVKQAGRYGAEMQSQGQGNNGVIATALVKTGSSTYASAVQKGYGQNNSSWANSASYVSASAKMRGVYLNAGDTIHGGAAVARLNDASTTTLQGDSTIVGATTLSFWRED